MPDRPTSDSSASTSPLLLTPESTGSQLAIVIDSPSSNAGSVSPSTTRKTRRQTAFYPNMNSSNKPQKPFSRSAAKRESVMALGSIEHLQHYFTKTGLASKKAWVCLLYSRVSRIALMILLGRWKNCIMVSYQRSVAKSTSQVHLHPT